MTEPDAAPRRNVDTERLMGLLSEMARIRAFEETAVAALESGLYPGFIHPSIGQEAVPVGVCAHLTEADPLLSTHRGHGHTMAKGATPTGMMCELFGRASGVCGGKGGSMHIADFRVGMLGANGVVGANILIAAGAAHALKVKGETGRVVACFFGDGAINRGPFLEGLNWARTFDLPVLFVCEENGFAATTRTGVLTAGDGPAARAESLGIPSLTVDGNDIQAVDEAAAVLVGAIRRGEGPRFLLAHTYRLTGHTSMDAAGYRPEGEAEERWTRDPISRCAERLRQAGVAETAIAAVIRSAEEEIEAALETAKDAPWPAPEAAFTDVQDLGAPVPTRPGGLAR
ncbi:thiamine pyrophosphate-dependent dehydrogenase E1 component subunit alpha [Roseospira goensis]|uniref:Pyruvate dehydrogenase E1 component alpha subunit n=1 Tax=Roseospira goensis TaxID=391922 RepID=A0A7W6WLY7_9PROT|nr:thiamine pyrophosphate-dependent dehydrogenase E1 component subunit alpha [Roseospira goensis]MBB4287369.1 pyruvate dehydrogenase E1 component alpha subunit [Roseospira goensis]